MISFVILIKLMPCRNLLQNWHRRSGFQDLILLVKALRDIAVLIFTRIAFQITVKRYVRCVRYLKSNKFLKSANVRSLATLYIRSQTVYILVMNRQTVIMRSKFLICTFIIIINNS